MFYSSRPFASLSQGAEDVEKIGKLQHLLLLSKTITMELLWDDICHNTTNIVSPDWHGNILKNREDQLQQGHEKFQDWTQAKKEIWDSVS